MRIKLYEICDDISFDVPKTINIVIENKVTFYNFCKYCFQDFSGEMEYISCFNNESLLKNDNVLHFIPNLFDLSLNNKKNINALYKILKQKYYDTLKIDISSLKTKIVDIVSTIASDFDVELTITNKISEDDLFKIMDLKFNDDTDTLLEQLIKYCSMIHELQKISTFVILHLHDYFEQSELDSLYHELKYKGISIISIENNNLFGKNNGDLTMILDKDLCSIL